MHCPSDEGPVIRWCPHIGCKMYMPRVFLCRLNKQSIIQIRRLTFKIVSMRSRQHSNVASISCETVIGLGRDVPGHPAFIRMSNWRSLTILCGRLFSAHHLAIWALKFCKWLQSKYKWSTHLDSSVVWAWWDILTGWWPWRVNTANIDPSLPPGCVFLNADSTRSWLKHLAAWLLRLDVAAWSFESR
jgi:hypothetical protein